MTFPFAQTIPVAHRGAHGPGSPENSLEAIARAVELGAPGIEFDVCSLANGKLVVHHEPSLACEAGEPVEPYLDLLADADALVLFDWKGDAWEHEAARSLRARGLLERTIFCSTDPRGLLRARTAEPALATGLSVDRPIDPGTLDRLLTESGAQAATLSRACVREELAAMLRRTRRGLFVWTFSGHEDAAPFLRFSPDGVITDAIEEELPLHDAIELRR
jgi:glycerophosphoryl diester phosphodiesterase